MVDAATWSLRLVLGLSVWLVAQSAASAQAPHPPLPKSHRHPDIRPWTIDTDIPEFSIAATPPVTRAASKDIATGGSGNYTAFTTHTVSDSQRFRLLVVERRNGKTREIRGLPFEWRPFTNLVWADSRTLVFDRWSSPHFGMHYAVDVVRGRLVAAVPFHDQ